LQKPLDDYRSIPHAFIRCHWQIEAPHYIRDVTYREDHSHIRTGSGPAVMAALRNFAIGILKFCGWTNIAQANRRHAQDPAAAFPHSVSHDQTGQNARTPELCWTGDDHPPRGAILLRRARRA
jgi:hypothetical protein